MAVDAKFLKDLITIDDVETVALSLGESVRTDVSGRRHIHCPGHFNRLGKRDNNDNSCTLTQKGYHCYACNETVDVFQMVQELTGWKFPDCVAYVAEQLGVEDTKNSRKVFPLSKGEIKMLNLDYDDARELWEKEPQAFLYVVKKSAEEEKEKIRQDKEIYCRTGKGALLVYEICEKGGVVDDKVWFDLTNSFAADIATINLITEKLGL